MKKRILTLALAIAVLCTVLVWPATAMNARVTVDGKTASYVLNWNTSYNGSYAATSYASTAYYLRAYVYYEYTIGGTSYSTTANKALNSAQSVSADTSVSGSKRVYTSSYHAVKSTSTSTTSTYSMSLYA